VVDLVIILITQECLVDFCNREHWTCNIGGHLSICQTPSPHGTSKTSTSSSIWSTTSSSMFTLRLTIVWLTQGWEKFTWSCLCESPFDQPTRFAFCLQEPYISSPSICVILMCKLNLGNILEMCLQVALDLQIGLLYTKETHSYHAINLVDHPIWNENIMSIVWKFEHNHPMSQHTSMLLFSEIIEAIHYALSLKHCMWACLQAFPERIYARQNNCLLWYLKMYVIIDVKLSRIWGEKKYVWEGWK